MLAPVSRFIRVRARFVDGKTGEPLAGAGRSVRLCDLDLLRDDLLGEGAFIAPGVVEVVFSLGAAASPDSPREDRPDLYLVLYEGLREVYRTPVAFDVEMPVRELFTLSLIHI